MSKRRKTSANVSGITDLASFLDLYNQKDLNLAINEELFHRVKDPLTKLNNMVGMDKLKKDILLMVKGFLIQYSQDSEDDTDNDDMELDLEEIVVAHEQPRKRTVKISTSDLEVQDSSSDDLEIQDEHEEDSSCLDGKEDSLPDWIEEDDDELPEELEEAIAEATGRKRKRRDGGELLDKGMVNNFVDAMLGKPITINLNFPSMPPSGISQQKDASFDEALTASSEHKLRKNKETLHTMITGIPGCGKTSVAKIIAEIYSCLGFLIPGKFQVVSRETFIGKWVGHSEAKTTKLLEECLGGVLFIDEAYSLGNGKDPDSFSAAVVNILNRFLTEHQENFVCIIAGYEKELEQSFFSLNPGLKRRFPWKFDIDKYDASELTAIFHKMIKDIGWEVTCPVTIFNNNMEKFPFYGGDVEILISKVKLFHYNRVFSLPADMWHKITAEDINGGYEWYIEHKNTESPAYKLYFS